MKANLEASKGLIYSQAVLLALTKKGLTREKAYEFVQRNAMKTWADSKTFKEFLLEDAEVMKVLTRREVDRPLRPRHPSPASRPHVQEGRHQVIAGCV